MNGLTATTRDRRLRWAVGLIAAMVYLATPELMRVSHPDSDHFPKLARAFLAGRISIPLSNDPGFRTNELIPSANGDAYYCAYPPLPAVLLMPFVALFGTAASCLWITRLMSAINVMLFDAVACRWSGTQKQPPLSLGARLAFDALFAFGTTTWHVARVGGDWQLAHAVTLAGGLLAAYELLGAARPIRLGACIAIVLLTRPTAALGCCFCLLPFIRRRNVHSLLKLMFIPGIACAMLGLYNAARFGSPFDFGYGRMILVGEGRELMLRYGQFHPHFILRNLFWFFAAPPWLMETGAIPIGYDPRGMSVFIATPALLYGVVALIRKWKEPLVRDSAISVALASVPLLLYFNTGYWQFGHRFSMDYLAAAMVLVMIGMGPKPSRLAVALVWLSVLIHLAGLWLPPTRIPVPEWITGTVA